MTDFTTYQSPFTWRYGSKRMREIFSEKNKYRCWRKIWLALARAQYRAGLLRKKEIADLEKNRDDIDVNRILEIEKETKHDVVAAIKEFAEKAKIGGGKIHLGATSMDIVDNADVLRVKSAIKIIKKRLNRLLIRFAEKIEEYAGLVCLGYTHLQPAEPTTVGYRLAFYAQDLLIDSLLMQTIGQQLLGGKGFKGAVGTSSSYTQLLKESNYTASDLEIAAMKNLGLPAFLVTSQVYPRKLDFIVLSSLASIAQSVHKFAFDLRIMQSPQIGEWSEPFAKKQVGSSAMPFKKNPIKSENICSLARYIAQLPRLAWDNAANSLLERTLDDSANRRIIIPEAFLATDQILMTAEDVVGGLVINRKRIKFNLQQYSPFAATEAIMMEAVKKGADRQEMHSILREISMKAWVEIQKGEPNPIETLLIQHDKINEYLSAEEIRKLLDVRLQVGNAPKKAMELVKKINRLVKKQ